MSEKGDLFMSMMTHETRDRHHKQPIEIWLLGQKIVLKSFGEPELVREVVELVSRKIKERESEQKGRTAVPPHHVALLALLSLAEEHVQAKRRFSEHQRTMDEKSHQLMSLIEAEIGE